MHTFGKFLSPHKNVLEYMDRFNVEKAIITTINRAKFFKKNDKSERINPFESENISNIMENFKDIMLKGQLSHQDVIDIANKAPERFFKFFWFNPNLKPEEEESNYKILENHFNKDFIGVKIHNIFHMFRVPRDILKLISFIQDYNKNIILFIHSAPNTSFFRGITCKEIAKLATKFPELRIIVGHAAYCMEYSLDVAFNLRKFKNVYFETSASASYGIYNIIKAAGHKHILFGSDSPVVSPIQLEIDKILTLPISNVEKQDILYNNVNKLLEFCRK
ncbi:MAG: amidohydrolase family protein [Promethearchaeota archaeon]